MPNKPQDNPSAFLGVCKLAKDLLARKYDTEWRELLDAHKREGIIGTEKALDEMQNLSFHHKELEAILHNILLTRQGEIESKARQFSELNAPYNKEWSLV
jgi:hypothetical protein